eukprot:7596108-Alexandrium_andersonii.AAC.1
MVSCQPPFLGPLGWPEDLGKALATKTGEQWASVTCGKYETSRARPLISLELLEGRTLVLTLMTF